MKQTQCRTSCFEKLENDRGQTRRNHWKRVPPGTGKQRGFSLVIVFMLLAMMSAAAMAVLLSARSDIRVSGHDRLNSVAFFSAEAGLAYGKAYMLQRWDNTTFWTPVLQDPQAVSGINRDYYFGGTAGLPRIEADYTFRFANNPDDPSNSPVTDSDGRLIIISTGRALDSTKTRALASVTLQMELEWTTGASGSTDYQAQSHQDVTGAAGTGGDTAPVDMSKTQSL